MKNGLIHVKTDFVTINVYKWVSGKIEWSKIKVVQENMTKLLLRYILRTA